jgi:type IV fimbrial biogenesis protein FimT
MSRQDGYTLVEWLVCTAVLAVIAGVTVPSMRGLWLDAARTREVNQFVQAVHLARAEAIKRNGLASLCASAGTDRCTAAGTPWQQGWIVFANLDADSPAQRDANEPVLQSYGAWPEGSITGNRATLSFRAFGQSGVTSTFTFCDARGSAAARAVIISQTGRPRVATRKSNGDPLDCP